MNALLLSGGLDSISLAWWLRPAIAFTVDYGQVSAEGEIRASTHVSSILEIKHEVIAANVRSLGAGDLAGAQRHALAPASEWWPFRNQLLITLAGMRCLALGVNRLLIGTVRTDGFHVDGRESFVETIDALCRMQEGNLRVEAPAIDLTSAELIRKSEVSIELLAWAHSCHTAAMACGICRGCNKHRAVMEELGYDVY